MPEQASIKSGSWTLTPLLLSDLIGVWAGKHHPDDPRLTRGVDPALAARIAAAKERSDARRKRLGITGSVL